MTGLAWTPPTPLECNLESERLIIRSFQLPDAQELLNAVHESRDNHLLPWLPWAKNDHRTIESSTQFICNQVLNMSRPDTFSTVGTAIFCKSSGRFLGGAGIHDLRRDTASCETGYWIRKDAIGNGYAGEACARTISWALESQANNGLGLQRVRIYCSQANKASTRLIEKLGITAEVHQRNDYFIEGIGPTDRLGWGVLADEWDCKKHCVIKS